LDPGPTRWLTCPRTTAADTFGNFGFIDQWFRLQAAKAVVGKIRTLNRQLGYLTKMPLNLKQVGVPLAGYPLSPAMTPCRCFPKVCRK
jgi:hypothetical protein